jgi:diketogulonate reductase-like aldo/keto reductase
MGYGSPGDRVILKSGYTMPCIGFGTYKMPDGPEASEAVAKALEYGYRHIDGAAFYKNEKAVGEGIREGLKRAGLSRDSIFVTSKVWASERGYDKVMASFEKTMEDIGLEYLDLFLIHWPADRHQHDNWEELNLDSWRALIDLYREGRVRSIGVSNFWEEHLEALMKTQVPPMVNQLEFHPGYMQRDAVAYCKENGIAVEAWSPLARNKMLDDPLILSLAGKYGKSPAQICIRWCLQNETVPLPKSLHEERIEENLDVFDFEISGEDMETMNAMETTEWSGHTPANVNYG